MGTPNNWRDYCLSSAALDGTELIMVGGSEPTQGGTRFTPLAKLRGTASARLPNAVEGDRSD
jgi:hypothetical protein